MLPDHNTFQAATKRAFEKYAAITPDEMTARFMAYLEKRAEEKKLKEYLKSINIPLAATAVLVASNAIANTTGDVPKPVTIMRSIASEVDSIEEDERRRRKREKLSRVHRVL